MLPSLDDLTGNLPLGRFPASLEQIELRFVLDGEFRASATRAIIWQDFNSLLDEVVKNVEVAWIWVGGSFLTSKIDPDDIDVVIWCKESVLEQVDDAHARQFLSAVATNRIREITGLRVDSRICSWHIAPETGVQENVRHHKYVKERGFWDDFWLRARVNGKGAPLQFEDALPKRGYLEIWLGGGE